jgi:hypothetical protein
MKTAYFRVLDSLCSVLPFGGWWLSDLSGLTRFKSESYRSNPWWGFEVRSSSGGKRDCKP